MSKTPYENTAIPASKSKGDIDELLKKIGAIAIQWTETTQSIRGNACPTLQFAVSRILNGVEQRFIVKIQAPLLVVDRGRGYDRKHMPNINASMRLLYWYVKSKAEAIEYGLEDIVESFMSRILVSLPDGSGTQTMADALKQRPQIVSRVFQLPDYEEGRE